MSFEKIDPLWGNFLTTVPKEFIVTPIHVLCAIFVEYGRQEVGEVVCYLPDKKKTKFHLTLSSEQIAPKMCQDQRQTMYSECPKFHPNQFTSGGVIAEHVNTVESRDEVNSILD